MPSNPLVPSGALPAPPGNPRAMAALDALRLKRNRVEVDETHFEHGLPAEVQFAVILAGQRSALVLMAVPDAICADAAAVMDWAQDQIREGEAQFSEGLRVD